MGSRVALSSPGTASSASPTGMVRSWQACTTAATGKPVPARTGSACSTVTDRDFTLPPSSRQMQPGLAFFSPGGTMTASGGHRSRTADWKLWVSGVAAPIACFVVDYIAGEHVLKAAPAALLSLAAIGIASLALSRRWRQGALGLAA